MNRTISLLPDSNDNRMEIFVSCRNLENMDVISKSDPQVILYTKQNNGKWYKLGQTEIIYDNLNPNFQKTFIVDYEFEKKQELKFEVIDIDEGNDHDFIGEVETTLGCMVGSKGQTAIFDLKNSQKNKSTGKLITRCETLSDNRDIYTMIWKCSKLPDLGGWFSKTDPYISFYRLRSDKTWLKVYETEIIKSNLNPTWKQFQVKAARFCNGNSDLPIKIEVMHHVKGDKDQIIGEVLFTIAELQDGKREFNIKNSKDKQSLCILDTFKTEQKPEFIDYLRGGTQIQLMIAVDFTGSNGVPTRPESLHALLPNGGLNQYQSAIVSVGEILLNYDHDKMVSLFGFGAKPKYPNLNLNIVSHCYPLTGDPNNVDVYGLQGVMDVYRYSLQHVELAGPTYFNPLITEACVVAEQNKSQNQDVYSILLILTDGAIHDMKETIDTICYAAYLPLSIIIVGVGIGDFSNMEILDGDQGLYNSKGELAKRDLVQFVPFSEFSGDPQRLANKVLEEIPDQLVQYYKLIGKLPNPPIYDNLPDYMINEQTIVQSQVQKQQQQVQNFLNNQQFQPITDVFSQLLNVSNKQQPVYGVQSAIGYPLNAQFGVGYVGAQSMVSPNQYQQQNQQPFQNQQGWKSTTFK